LAAITLQEQLLQNIKAKLPELKKLLKKINSHWCYEDHIYRFYHYSYKVYGIQDLTIKIVEALKTLDPNPEKFEMNSFFDKIYKEGTGKKFKSIHNKNWTRHTRPMVEAFLHAKYFLEMAIRYGKTMETTSNELPSGWAGLLYFYGLR